MKWNPFSSDNVSSSDDIKHPLIQAVSQVLHGKEHAIALSYASMLAGGHVLLEDVPGVGKTTLAHALATTAGLPFKRLQCTNDMLPSDILGASVWDPESRAFVFHEGPVFTNVLVADEINRAPSKSQSALLEAMEEQQVSIDGAHYTLPRPFWVVATQNPTDHSGVNELPESQLDRFLIKLSLGYPDERSEKKILSRTGEQRRPQVSKVLNLDVEKERALTQQVMLSDEMLDYLYRLVRATREYEGVELGLSPRAALGWVALAKAWAWLHRRESVAPQDIKATFKPLAGHRMVMRHSSTDSVLSSILESTPIHP